MVKYIAVDADTRRIIAVAPSEEQAMLWAEIRSPESAVVLLCDGRSYSIFTDPELRELLFNATGAKVEGGSYGQVLEYLKNRLQELPCDDTIAEELLEILAKKRQAPDAALQEQKEKAQAPRHGGISAKVWELAELCSKENPDVSVPELRKIIIDRCTKEGINLSTASTQYARWKKSQGY